MVSNDGDFLNLLLRENLSAETSLPLVVVFFNGLSSGDGGIFNGDVDSDGDGGGDGDGDGGGDGDGDFFIGKLGSMSFSTNISYIAVVLIALEIILRKSCGALFNG